MTDLIHWCHLCRAIAGEVVGDDMAARAELDRIKKDHRDWHANGEGRA